MTNLTDSESEQFLSQVERVRIEIKDKFSKSHQLLHEREAALLLELDQLVASYKGEEIRKQIQQISSSKESIISALKKNENYEALQLSIVPLNARIRELEVSLETTETRMRGVELEWDGELQGRLRETGRIRIIGQFDYKKKDTSLQEQPVTLIWKKQLTTIETKITYFDSLNGAIQLNLDKLNNSFTSSAYLTPGNHNGILTLSDSDYNGETELFHVLRKSDVVQEFTLSLVNIPNPGDGMKSSSVKGLKEGYTMKTMKSRLKDFEERVKSLEQRCDHLFKENEKLKKRKIKDQKIVNA